MSIRGVCHGCGATLQIPDRYAGRMARCPQCQATFRVPQPVTQNEPNSPQDGMPSAPSEQQPSATDSALPAESQPRQPSQMPPADFTEAAPQSHAPDMPDFLGGDAQPSAHYTRVRSRYRTRPKKQGRRFGVLTGTAAAILGMGLVAWAVWFLSSEDPATNKTDAPPIAYEPPPAPVDEPAEATQPSAPLSLADLIEQVDDGVVLITGLDAFGEEVALGSGFIIDMEGLVATNYHVIATAAQARIQFRDGTQVDVLGYRAYDPSRDLAILELAEKPEKLEILQLGRSENPRQGEEVIAIGHPSGFKFTTTTGIVSGVYSTAELPRGIQYFLDAPADNTWIQTNAVISQGNSGGPLLNHRGEVIGINTWVASNSNLGFAAHVRHLADLKQNNLLGEAIALDVAGRPGISTDTPLGQIESQVAEVINDYRRANEEFLVEIQQAADEAEQKSLFQSKNPVLTFAPKLLDLAESHRQTQTAFQALYFTCQMVALTSPEALNSVIERATERLLQDHIEEQRLLDLAVVLAKRPEKSVHAFLRNLSEQSPHRDVRGVAAYCLAMALDALATADETENPEVITLLERVVADYSDVIVEGTTLGQQAEPLLFERKHLAIGKLAPEIVGRDMNGVEFRLSDYRGQVVMLDFWGDWCPYCVEMYPEQRLLVESKRDEPFVLLGINTDTKDRLRKVLDSEQVTWRSWWDGPDGPIARRWGVSSVPMTYVLDHTGTIRYKNVRGEELTRAVEQLLKEVPDERMPESNPPIKNPTEN